MTPPDEPSTPEDYLKRLQSGQPSQPAPPNPYEQTAPYAQQPGEPPAYPPAGQYPPQQQPYGQQGYGQQSYQGPGYGQPFGQYGVPTGTQHPSATTSMVLGIIGLAGILFCGGFTLVLSPFAWAMGRKAVREIDAEPGRYAGRDQAKGGQIMGIIGTVLLVIGIVLVTLLIVGIFAASESYQSPPGPAPSLNGQDF